MFQTKKRKFIMIVILIATFFAGALCTYALLGGHSDKETDSSEKESSNISASSGQVADDALDSSGQKTNIISSTLGQESNTVSNSSENGNNSNNLTSSPKKDDTPKDTQSPTKTLTDTPAPENEISPTPLGTADESITETEPKPTSDEVTSDKTAASLETTKQTPDKSVSKEESTATQTPFPAPDFSPTPTDNPTVTNIAKSTITPEKTTTPTSAPSKTPTPKPTLTVSPSGMDGSVSTNGQLKVSGTRLVNSSDDPVILRGVSTHGIAWFPDFATKSFMQTLRDEWGASVFRIAMYSYEGNDSYVNNPEWNKAKVCGLIDAAIELDMYVIVDWHILADGNPQTYQKQAGEFFTYIASTYPGIPNILYEICNEPNGGSSWSGNIKPYANDIIPKIRQYSPEAVILVGTPTWSQDVDAAAADPLSFDNIMYSLHFYAGTHKENLRNKADIALAKGLALFVTEWGTTDASGNGAVDKNSTDEWLTYLEKNQISWCNWSLCNKSESSAILLPSAAKDGTMPDSFLSESGKYVKKKMLEYSGTTPVEQKPQNPTLAPSKETTPSPEPTPAVQDNSDKAENPSSSKKPSASDKTDLTLLYYNENREDSTNTISPHFQIKNNSENEISLDKITILYYYTPEKEIAQCFFCDYAEVNGISYRAITSDVTADFVSGKNSGMKITFSSGAGTMAPGDTATLQIRIANEDWSNYIQSNDASYLPDANTYTESDKVVLNIR